MLPIADDNRFRRSVPVVTYVLIALNIAFFLVELSQGEAFVEKWAFIPRQFLANPGGEFLTLFTSMFMHAGWLHLGSNMLYLWIFGDNVEDRFGQGTFLVFYLLCGLAPSQLSCSSRPTPVFPNLGASGAIAGVLGAYLLLFPQGRVHVLQGQRVIPVPALDGHWTVVRPAALQRHRRRRLRFNQRGWSGLHGAHRRIPGRHPADHVAHRSPQTAAGGMRPGAAALFD